MTQKNSKNKNLLSALIVAHNEENNLDDCLAPLVDFCDEIVVILDKCTDNSKKIAAKYTKNIVEGSWKIEGERRNVGIANCNGLWILELDADQRISKALAKEIITKIKGSEPCHFEAKIQNYIGDKYIKYGWLRIMAVDRQHKVHFKGLKKYHEDKMVHPTADIEGEIKSLQNPVKHFMDKDIGDMISRFNNYTTLKALDAISSGKTKVKCGYGFFSFINRFCKAFFIKKGYKEGRLGFIIAIFAALYPLVVCVKIQEKLKDKKN